MGQFFQIHADNPQERLIQQVVDVVEKGGVIIYPTDSGYALGCGIGEKNAADQIRAIRQLDSKHNFTLVCRDLSEISTYAKVSNQNYRLLKQHTPGGFTFILPATSEVPNRLVQAKRKTIGIRVPDNAIAMALLGALRTPLMSVSLIMPGEDLPMTDPYEIFDLLEKRVDLIINGGYCGVEPTTVVELFDDTPKVTRQGLGDASAFGVV